MFNYYFENLQKSKDIQEQKQNLIKNETIKIIRSNKSLLIYSEAVIKNNLITSSLQKTESDEDFNNLYEIIKISETVDFIRLLNYMYSVLEGNEQYILKQYINNYSNTTSYNNNYAKSVNDFDMEKKRYNIMLNKYIKENELINKKYITAINQKNKAILDFEKEKELNNLINEKINMLESMLDERPRKKQKLIN